MEVFEFSPDHLYLVAYSGPRDILCADSIPCLSQRIYLLFVMTEYSKQFIE